MEIDQNPEFGFSSRETPGTPPGPPVNQQNTSEKSDSRDSIERADFAEGTGAYAAGPARPAGFRRAKSSLRLKYEAETQVIERKLGDLEAIRATLGLTQRKMAQLLLVDPSAWTRWTKGDDQAPPHIYRMLQWYLALEEKYPALDVNFWLSTVAQVPARNELFAEKALFLETELRQTRDQLEQTNARFERMNQSALSRERALRRLFGLLMLASTLAGGAIGFALSHFAR